MATWVNTGAGGVGQAGSTVYQTPPVGYWTYWFNSTQVFIPHGTQVQNTSLGYNNANCNTLHLITSNGYMYQVVVPQGVQSFTVCSPVQASGAQAPIKTLRDDELILELIARGYAVWKPDPEGKE